MHRAGHTGFLLRSGQIRNNILIPRYYDPRLADELRLLKRAHNFVSLDSLIANRQLRHDQGSYIPRIHYGTGSYPYIRTSDLANWELKASPKHGVPRSVYEEYADRQDVQAGDLILVHEGTYLIGSAAMITTWDLPMLFQHHLARFRLEPNAPFGPYYLLTALATRVVQRQIRSKQFSADIIDSVVGRMGEIVIPYPKDARRLANVERTARRCIESRVETREHLSQLTRLLDQYLQHRADTTLADVCYATVVPDKARQHSAFLGGRTPFMAFTRSAGEIKHSVLIPKYYDPSIELDAAHYAERCELVTVDELQAKGVLQLDTGDEIGRLNYGSGSIPFIRTSDFGSWELKRDAKHGVAKDIYERWKSAQNVQRDDILLVRDGTYLVGTSVLIQATDLPLLYCGGIIRIRSLRAQMLSAPLLLALLNTPFVRRQIRNKQFTRDIIDTLGRRFGEVMLPVPRLKETRNSVTARVRKLLVKRTRRRQELIKLAETLFSEA